MLHKKRLIIAGVLAAVTITVVIVVASVVGILFLRSSGDTVAMPGTTSVGVPNGPATTKSIGPAGGSIASPDGRITVDVPPNAVPGPVNFSIQPITNLAHGGLGNAYRLEPSEQNFATPVKVSFSLDAQAFKGTAPETLAVAYQDKTGVWQAFRTINIDQAKKTLTVSTTHFTDFSVWTIRLSPEKAALRVRETQYIELIGCIEKRTWVSRLRTRLGIQTCTLFSPEEGSWSVNIGTITPAGPGAAVYQAPATRPSTNVATVRYVYKLRGSGEADLKDVRYCKITIVGRGYRATGQTADLVYSGVICSLDKPFTVYGSIINYKFEFVPSSATAGTVTITAAGMMVTGEGGGKYTIEGADTDKPRIALAGTVVGHSPVGSRTGSGTVYIDLVPLETDECSKK